jgi:hypothetical protein
VKYIDLQFFKLSEIAKLLMIIFIICGDFYSGFSEDFRINAQTASPNLKVLEDLSFSKQIDHFLHCLIKATKDECVQIFRKYNTIISHELDFKKLYFVSYEEVPSLEDGSVVKMKFLAIGQGKLIVG